MNDTRDPEISRLYRDASAEAPPAALDQALRAAAAAALAQPAAQSPTPGVIAGPARRAQRKWGAPLALAASVVLGLGVVLRVAVERPDMRPAVAEPAAAPAPASAPAAPPPAPAGGVSVAKQAGSNAGGPARGVGAMANQPVQEGLPPVSEKRESLSSRALANDSDQIQAQRKSAPPKAAAKPAGQGDGGGAVNILADAAPRPAEPAKRAAPEAMPVATPGPEARAAAAPVFAPSAPDIVRMQRDADTVSQRIPPEARSAMAERKAEAVAAQSARARAEPAGTDSATAESEQRMIAEERGLAEAEWIKRIIDLRRAGRSADADASLRRFMLRYPGYVVPEAARGR
jgi:hypothetical protein